MERNNRISAIYAEKPSFYASALDISPYPSYTGRKGVCQKEGRIWNGRKNGADGPAAWK